jgi:hypothetical protein
MRSRMNNWPALGNLDSVLDVLRIYRNDAGHPTSKRIGRDDAFINLQMVARVLQKLYALKGFFNDGACA